MPTMRWARKPPKDVFDQVDVDKTGAVEMGEWDRALSATGIPMELLGGTLVNLYFIFFRNTSPSP